MEVAEGGGWGEDVQEPDDLKRRWPVRAGQLPRPSAPVLWPQACTGPPALS